MNWIDAVIVILFLYFIVTAFSAGLVREVIGTGSSLLGVALAGLFYQDVADSVLGSIDNSTTASFAGFLIIFLGISIAGQLLAMIVHPAITVLQLGIIDQLAGAMFGAVKAFVIIEVLLILFVTYPRYELDKRVDDSQFAGLMLRASRPMTAILPDIFDKKVDAFKQ